MVIHVISIVSDEVGTPFGQGSRSATALGTCLDATSSSPRASADDTGHAPPPHLAAGVGGNSSPSATTSTTSVVSFTEQEIMRLRDLLIASGSPFLGASTSTSIVEPLTEQEIAQLQCLLCCIFWFCINRFSWSCYQLFWHCETTFYTSRYISVDS